MFYWSNCWSNLNLVMHGVRIKEWRANITKILMRKNTKIHHGITRYEIHMKWKTLTRFSFCEIYNISWFKFGWQLDEWIVIYLTKEMISLSSYSKAFSNGIVSLSYNPHFIDLIVGQTWILWCMTSCIKKRREWKTTNWGCCSRTNRDSFFCSLRIRNIDSLL